MADKHLERLPEGGVGGPTTQLSRCDWSAATLLPPSACGNKECARPGLSAKHITKHGEGGGSADLIGRAKQPVIYHKVCHGLPGGDLVGVAERPDINVPMCGQAARTASAKTPEFLQQHLLYGRGPDRVYLSHVESLANKLDPPRDCEGSSYFFTEGN